MGDSLRVAQVYTEFTTKGLGSTERGINSLKNKISGVKSLMAGLVGSLALKSLAGSFVTAAKEAEDYRTSIRAVSGSIKEADETFNRVKNWAAINPINTDEAIGAFVRLKTAAVKNSEEALTAIADVSTVMHRDMRDVASAVVTTEVEQLRNLGIMLDRTGKKAILESNGIRIEVEKDINSIRAGIIELMGKSFGGSLEKAKGTWSGALATMGGMWTNFKTDVMGEGKDTGAFGQLKDVINGINSEWEQFTASNDYKELISSIQDKLIVAIKTSVSLVKGLGTAFKIAGEHADTLKKAIYAIIGYKGALLAMSGLQALLGSQLAQLMSLLPAAMKSIGDFLAWIKLAGLAIGPAGLLATAVGAGVWLLARDQMKEAEEQAKKTKDIIDKTNETFAKASTEEIRAELITLKERLKEVTKYGITANKAMLELSTQKFLSRNGVLGGNVAGSIKELTAEGEHVKKIKTEIATLEKMLVNLEKVENATNSKGKNGKASGNGANANEDRIKALVANIRDQIKYLGADGESFIPVIDKWIAKTKVLSDDWKLLKDLGNEITENKENKIIEDAKIERKAREKEDAEYSKKLEQEQAKIANSFNALQWGEQQGLISTSNFVSQTKALFADLLEKTGLSMEEFAKWPEQLKTYFSAMQSAIVQEVAPAMELLKGKYEQGMMSLGEYKEALTSLMSEYGNVPQVVKNITESLKGADSSILSFKNSLGSMLKDATTNFNNLGSSAMGGVIESFSRFVAYGEDVSDTLKRLAQDVAYTITKMFLLKAVMGLFGGLFGGGSSAPSIASAFTPGASFGSGMGQVIGGQYFDVPTFHTGGIVGQNGKKWGLRSDETLAKLQTNEAVLSRKDMASLSGGGAGGGETHVHLNVQAIDSKSFRDFMTDNRGVLEGVVLDNISRNGSIRKAIQRGGH
ncbi:MAG: hypothetical protein RR203_02500 [Synergistaceae bacterium]